MAHELRVEGDKVIESDSKGHVLATKDYSHVHAGYVATTHNPRVSEGAKQNAEQLLHDLEAAHGDAPSTSHTHAAQGGGGGGEEHVPTTAENPHDTRSHDHPQEFHQHDQDTEQEKTHSEEVHLHRQIGGYKATLKREGVSDEAKQHAREELNKLGVPRDEYE